MNRRSTNWRSLSVAMLALFAFSCAQMNGDVVRIQPNVVRKSDLLDGQWFFRNTVTWTPFNTQFTFPGQTGNMEKLVWEIQEGNLVGYRSYAYTVGADSIVDPNSKIAGTTGKYCDAAGKCTGGQKYYGAPVVAFPIVSHFDIQRGYNAATGEVNNVISENTTDRFWNQREYIRVNWSTNVLNKASGLNWGTVQNPQSGVTNSNWIQPNEPGSDPYDWPTFEYKDPDGKDGPLEEKLTYFDVTGRYMAMPDSIYFEGYGNIPLCWFASGIYDCSASEIHIRTSIAKVDTTWSRDYEPLQFPNDLMSYFGYFRTDRLNYDRKFGYNDQAVIRLANRHRVWKEYYQKADGEVTDQPIAMAARTPEPIKYYFTPASRMGGVERYDEFWEPGRIIERDYDRAFRRAIGAAQQKDPSTVRQMFYVCNSPVKSGDPAECGNAGFSPKIGDLRYSFINTIAEPVANGLLGYGPSSADPETGQVISGMSNTYTWGVDLYGRDVTNWILLLNKEKSTQDYISGVDVADFVKNNPTYNIKGIQKSGLLQSELQGISTRNEETKGAWDRPTQRMASVVQSILRDKSTISSKGDQLKKAADELAKNPALEAAVLDNPDVQNDLLNLLPPFARGVAARDPNFLRQASRSVLTNIKTSQNWEKQRIEWLTKNSITTFDFYDRTLIGIATEKLNYRNARVAALVNGGAGLLEVDAKRIADDEIAKQVRQQVWLATSLHEAGHTLNLRHNFQGSYDAINYFDEYWDIRKDTITVQQNNQAKLPRTPADMKKAAEGTEAQLITGMHNHEYSSIMDYSGKIFTDFNGLGKYDEAAIIFAYSGDTQPGYVEVFDNARKTSKVIPTSDGLTMTISGAGADLPMVNVTHTNPNIRNYTERFHYSTVPLHFGEGSDVVSIMNDGLLKLRQRRLAKWSDVMADETRVRDALRADPTLINDPDRAAGVIGNVQLRVPYMFCSDESADGPVLSCNRFDRGPDYYEITRTKLEDYWNYYLDTHFRRDSVFFSGNSAVGRTFNTFYTVANSYKHWVYEVYQKSSRNQEQVARYKLDPILQDYWTMAVLDGVNQHLNVMSVPPDGLFMYRNLRGGPRWDLISQGEDFDYLNPTGRAALEELYTRRFAAQDFMVIPRGLGRRMYSRYDFKSGFGFWNRMLEAGHYNDQVGAMFAAVIPEIDIQGVDITADQDRYAIPYYLTFRDEFQSTFSSLWANDEEKIRPVAYKAVNEVNAVQDRAAIEWRTYVRGTDFFTNFNYPRERANCAAGQQPYRDECWVPNQRAAPANIQLTWTSRIYGLFLGMALFRVNYDLDYAKANQVFKLGSGEAFQVAAGYHTVEVPDVTTGHRYAAIEKDGAPPNSTGAIRMVDIANQYLVMVRDPATCPLPDYVFFQGFQCLPADQANNPALLEDRRKYWTEIFQDSIRDLGLQRSMYQIYGKAF
ncbi:MAG: hypothetical protein Q8N23_09220 [Archangium sp.]|nr:hypothetical protein [Archangium sp.]MDP3576094.1 hypothetical protein [Archangium sp.]